MKKSNLSILIPDGESSLALPVVRCLSQYDDLRVDVLSTEPNSIVRFSRGRRKYLVRNSQDRVGAILDAIKKTKADIVLPVDQLTIRSLGIDSSRLSKSAAIAPIPTSDAFETVEDKWLFAQFLEKKNISSPATILYQEGIGFEREISKLRFPALIKPTHGTGGSGIKFFDRLTELRLHLEKLSNPEKLIIQSFIKGYDIDCSVLCKDGDILAYTIQKGFVSHSDPFGPPAGVEFLYHEQVYNLVRQLMSELKWSGVAHIDLRYDEENNQPVIIEINPRFWGSLVGSLIAGVNFPYLSCLVALQENFPKPEYEFKKYVNVKARVGLLKQRFLSGNVDVDPWIGDTGFNLVLKDPLPEIFKVLFRIKNG